MPQRYKLYKTPPGNAKEILLLYINSLKQIEKTADIHQIKSAFTRFVIPALGGSSPIGKKATEQEVSDGLQFLEQINLAQLQNAKNILEEYFQKIKVPKEKCRLPRHSLNKMLGWLEEQGWLLTEDLLNDEIKTHRMTLPRGQRLPLIKSGGKMPVAVHAFGFQEGDILSDYLLNQIEEFKNFSETRGIRPATYEHDYINALRFLGWFYHYKCQQNYPMEKLCFETVIPVINTNIDISKFILDEENHQEESPSLVRYLVANYKAKNQAKIAGEAQVKLFEEYAKFLAGHPKTLTNRLQSIINVAKYLYKTITEDDDIEGYHDIPVIEAFRRKRKLLQRIARKTEPTVTHDVKNIPWEQAMDVLNQLRIEVDKKYNYTKIKDNNHRFNQGKRTFSAMVGSYQKFLLLGFMILMPPDRSRTYQELEVGKTLVWGEYDGLNFTTKEKMTSPEYAKVYLKLNRLDYKTGDTYGEYWCEVPNRKFPNGKRFYEYIDTWLTEYRPNFAQNHNKFFTMNSRGKQFPWNTQSIRQRILGVFKRFTKTPVSPKELRTMYVTNLKRVGASYAELESASVGLHHSMKTLNNYYDRLDQYEKLKPIASLNEKIWEDYWSKYVCE